MQLSRVRFPYSGYTIIVRRIRIDRSSSNNKFISLFFTLALSHLAYS